MAVKAEFNMLMRHGIIRLWKIETIMVDLLRGIRLILGINLDWVKLLGTKIKRYRPILEELISKKVSLLGIKDYSLVNPHIGNYINGFLRIWGKLKSVYFVKLKQPRSMSGQIKVTNIKENYQIGWNSALNAIEHTTRNNSFSNLKPYGC